MPETPSSSIELTLAGLYKRFPGVDWVVRGVELGVREGEILSVLGPSGCGKTTLLRLIAGFETPDRGEIRRNGEIISRTGWTLPPEQRHIGMVFQEYTLFPHLTVRENVQFGLVPPLGDRLRGLISRELPASTPEHRNRLSRKEGLVRLMDLCGLAEMSERYPHELSGGQQQRVALARALATGPGLLLLDEPFSNLDSSLRQRLREEVRSILKKAGTTSILVTHDQEEAVNMGDRMAVMNQGRLEQVGTPLEVMQNPQNRFVASFIGLNRFLPGAVEGERIISELGEFPLPGHGVRGGRVDILLRPNQVLPCHNGTGVGCQVIQVQYLSGQPLFTLALPSGREIQALLPGSENLQPGDHTQVRFEPSPLVVFPAE